MSMSRRTFLGSSAAAVLVAGTMAKGKVFGANGRVQVACVGIRGQGNSHRRDLLGMSDDCDVVALCDVDSDVLSQRVAETKEMSGKTPRGYADVRELLADSSVEAITIATPNHWHSLLAIWACEAGKDVYVEKPLSHNIWEGRQLVAAAEKYKRVVMHGTQQRSSSTRIRDMKLIHDGFIGDIVHTRGVVYKNGNRGPIGHGSPADPPANLNYLLWQGPATDKPYLKNESGGGLFIHYNWHWFWHWGNGEIGNQGVHEMDVAAWAMNKGAPVKVSSTGGRFGLNDDGETPNTQVTHFTYADGTIMTFEVRNLGSLWEGGKENCTNSVYGTKGYWIKDVGFFDYDERKRETPLDVPLEPGPSRSKWNYFLDAVRSRDMASITAPALDGHISCIHCHLGNIAYRLGRTLNFDPKTETFKGDEEANSYLKRDYREGFAVPQLA